MNIDDMRKAVQDAKGTLSNTDRLAEALGEMLVGRLRYVSNWTLRKLKRELRNYNPHTKTWKS